MKTKSLFIIFLLFSFSSVWAQIANQGSYLNSVVIELQKTWPQNRTVNIVFHGHSVPSGYFITPTVKTLAAYPHLTLQNLKEIYTTSVLNVITTSIGGENAEVGEKRFVQKVLTMCPDVLYIDYGLNDRGIGLERARTAWVKMIEAALAYGCKVILFTPTPDTSEDILSDSAPLAAHSAQIRELAAIYKVGLVDSYANFKKIKQAGENINDYMSQYNHPNEIGHKVVADEIIKWYNPVADAISPNLYFDFENNDETKSLDKIAQVRGTFNGSLIVNDTERGKVLSLPTNSANMKIEAQNIFSNEFTLSFWLKLSVEEIWKNVFFFKEANNVDLIGLVKENWVAQNQFCFYKTSIGGIVGTKEKIQPNVWYHIILSVTNDVGTMYLNGIMKDTAPLVTKGYNFTNYYLGTPNNTTSISYLDDVMFFPNAFTAENATYIYNSQKNKQPSGVQHAKISNYKLYPNPIKVNEELTISAANLKNDIFFSLINPEGKILFTKTTKPVNGKLTYIPTEKGIYFIKLNDNHTEETVKIVVV